MDAKKNLSFMNEFYQAKKFIFDYYDSVQRNIYCDSQLREAISIMRQIQYACPHDFVARIKKGGEIQCQCLICESMVQSGGHIFDLLSYSVENSTLAMLEIQKYLPGVLAVHKDEIVISNIVQNYLERIFWDNGRKLKK